MAHVDADRNLLFGLLALQNGLIDQSKLVAAFQAWTLDKARDLAGHLLAFGALDADDRSAVEALVERHLKKHGGDVELSLAATRAGRSTRDKLAEVNDPALDATLARLCSGSTECDPDLDPDRTANYSLGTTTSLGQRFRVLRPHAQGGLGAVFVALDTELHREVALKQVLDSHADDPVTRQRFVVEAEITGGLEHPGIVPVYGLGSYGNGRPYYAMRFVRGDSLKVAIDRFHADAALKSDPGRRSLELRKLLRRFVDVCNAIDYAHARGVLHRDIKPGNVIVGKHGETLVVDWGLAKARGRHDAAESSEERPIVPSSASGSAETLPGSALGTPAYMSPEQARGDVEALGPRSDVYSLGATLYCLLTGRPPFAGDVGEVLQAVQQGKFDSPRHVDPTLDTALEAVCKKAMAVRADDRYATCRALAEDLERWMADEPVSAWHEPIPRRALRWARQNRTAVSGAAAAMLAGLVGLAAVAVVQSRSNRELKAAHQETSRALVAEKKARNEATEALAQSEDARKRTQAVLGFLKNDVLAATRPEGQEGGLGVEVTVRKAVDAAEAKIAEAFQVQPIVEAEVRDTLGQTYLYLGEAALAIRQLERAVELRETKLGTDHADTLTSRNNLASAYHHAGRTADAITLHEATLKQQQAKLGPDHSDTLNSRNNLAVAYRAAGRTDDAIKMHEATLKERESKLGPDHPDTLESRNSLATAYLDAGHATDAIKMHEATLEQRETKLGADHPDTIRSRNNLASAYRDSGRIADAVRLFETTLKQRESKLGGDHPDTLISRNNLALAYRDAGRIDEAITLFEATLRDRESKLGPDHPGTLRSRNNLALAYRAAGRLADALKMHEETLKRRESKLGPDHPETLNSRNNLAAAYRDAGRTDDAIKLYEATLKQMESKLGPEHPTTLQVMNNLLGLYLAINKWTEAEPLARRCLGRREKTRPDEWNTFNTRSQLGGSLLGQKKFAEAEPFILAGYEGMKAREAKIPATSKPRLTEASLRVVELYEDWGKKDKAAEWRAKMAKSPAEASHQP